jgi:hypothetical protein
MKLNASFILPTIFQLLLIGNSYANLQSDRLLADCPNQFFYTTSIGMIDSYENNHLSCSTAQLQAIGSEINKIYDAAMMFDTTLLANTILIDTTVCPKAITSGRRHLRAKTEDNQQDLATTKTVKYNWGGRGTCRLCPPDNLDRRKMLLAEDDRDDFSIIGRQLATNYTYKLVDFSTDSAGNKLTVRNYVKYEWRNQYGMTVTVNNTNGFAPEERARIFNTANVTGGAYNLGAPNQKCDPKRNPPYPGQGDGGKPGMPGKNCKAQGNVLIIQETEQWDPGMWKQSGDFVFTFDSPTRIGSIGLMDMSANMDNGPKGWIVYKNQYGKSYQISFTGLGANSIQTVTVNRVVKQLTVVLKQGGAVRNIEIFTPTTAEEALSDEALLFLADRSFVQYIPTLEFDLSYFLTRQINAKFGRNPASCLFDKWADITVQLKEVPTMGTIVC